MKRVEAIQEKIFSLQALTAKIQAWRMTGKTIAFTNGWISAEKLLALAQPYKNTGYGKYLLKLLD